MALPARHLLIFVALSSGLTGGALAADVPAPTTAPAASSTTQLGKLKVTGMRPLVEVLQQMKTAINAPFSNDPKHYDDMVCRLERTAGSAPRGCCWIAVPRAGSACAVASTTATWTRPKIRA